MVNRFAFLLMVVAVVVVLMVLVVLVVLVAVMLVQVRLARVVELIQELLAVLDNYHRAEQLVEEGGHSVEEIADGLMKTSEQLVSILKQEGLKEVEIVDGDPFDPNIHEAMLAEHRDGLDQDTVLEVFQKGYTLGQDLLRPARVRVGKPLSSSATGEQSEAGVGE